MSLLARGVTRKLLGKQNPATADFLEAHRLRPDDPEVLSTYGMDLLDRKLETEGIDLLRRAVNFGGGGRVQFFLAMALRDRNGPGDRVEATRLCLEIVRAGPGADRPEPALEMAVLGLIEQARWEQVHKLLDEEVASADSIASLRAKVRLAQGNREEAQRLADEALAGVSVASSPNDRRRLALLLTSLDRPADALALWQGLAVRGRLDPDMRQLLNCVHRLRRDDLEMDLLEGLRKVGVENPDLLHSEAELVRRYDRPKAVEILQQHLHRHPEDRIARMQLSVIGLASGCAELVSTDLDQLPSLAESPFPTAQQVVCVLQQSGCFEVALRAAYELLRRNFDQVEAHRLYLWVVFDGEQREWKLDPDGGAGLAYAFREEGEPGLRWAIIEEAPGLDPLPDELATDHASYGAKGPGTASSWPGGTPASVSGWYRRY